MPNSTALCYNTAAYKTGKMAVRKVPRWSDKDALPNSAALSSLNVVGAEGVDFETLKSLPKLQALVVGKGAFSDAQKAELQAAHPKMRITER